MNWNQVEKAWLKLTVARPELRVITEKVDWVEVRLHNAPHSHAGFAIPELPEEVFVFWPEGEIGTRRDLLARRGPAGMSDYDYWGSEDRWVGPPATAEMLAQSEVPGRSLLAAWVSAVLHDSKGEREVNYDLEREVLQSIPEGYHPWTHNTKHMLRDIVSFGEEFNLERGKSHLPVRTLDDLVWWVAKNAIHNQRVYRPVRVSSTYDADFRPLSVREQLQAAAARMDAANKEIK